MSAVCEYSGSFNNTAEVWRAAVVMKPIGICHLLLEGSISKDGCIQPTILTLGR